MHDPEWWWNDDYSIYIRFNKHKYRDNWKITQNVSTIQSSPSSLLPPAFSSLVSYLYFIAFLIFIDVSILHAIRIVWWSVCAKLNVIMTRRGEQTSKGRGNCHFHVLPWWASRKPLSLSLPHLCLNYLCLCARCGSVEEGCDHFDVIYRVCVCVCTHFPNCPLIEKWSSPQNSMSLYTHTHTHPNKCHSKRCQCVRWCLSVNVLLPHLCNPI